jgi:hypothetical protein
MNELAAEWLHKAEGDYLVLLGRYSGRYRGESADKDEARAAFRTITCVREWMRGRIEGPQAHNP